MDAQSRIMKRFHIQEMHSNWTSFDKAKAIAVLKNETGLSIKEMADLLGLTPRTVENYLSLLTLSKRTIHSANDGKIPFSYLKQITEVIASVDFDKREAVEDALVQKIQDRVVTRAAELTGYKMAIKADERVIQKLVDNKNYTTKQALKDAKIEVAVANKRLVINAAWLVTMFKHGIKDKTNRELSDSDVSTLRKLIAVTESFIEGSV
jgi:predicted transcriptional regulator